MEVKKANENVKALELEIKANYNKINELVMKNHELQKNLKYVSESEIKIKAFEKKIKENSHFEELEVFLDIIKNNLCLLGNLAKF